MLKGMSLDQKKKGGAMLGKQGANDDSDGGMDVDESRQAMAQPTKAIFKRKIRNREYY